MVYKVDIAQILKTREVDVGGSFKVGQAVAALNEDLQAELVELRQLATETTAETPYAARGVKGGVNLDHFGGAKVDQLVKG